MIDKLIDSYHLDTPLDEYVADDFQLRELIRSETADRHGIDNRIPTVEILHAAICTARRILQPIRNQFGAYRPNSVFRSQALERALKGKPASWVSTSQHTRGEAADVEVPGVRNVDLAYWIRANLEFDQLILECYNPALGTNSGWVHASIKRTGGNRNQVLSYIMVDGRYRYVDGIVHDAAAIA